MKHTLLASTALVALNSTAFAEVTVSGSARIGFMTTEGTALVAADTTMAISAADEAFAVAMDNLALYKAYGDAGTTATAVTATATNAAVTTGCLSPCNPFVLFADGPYQPNPHLFHK